MIFRSALMLCVCISLTALNTDAADTNRQVMVRDITNVEGVRDNLLVGYGLVTGLRGTGDTQQTIFTMQTLANAMQKMGVLVPAGTAVVKNVAAVFITASLPPICPAGRQARRDRFFRRRCAQPRRRHLADERTARTRWADLRRSAGTPGDGRLRSRRRREPKGS